MSGLVAGVVLVPKETPFGPAAAREAWADELGQLLVVVDVREGGAELLVNCRGEGATYRRSTGDVLAEYEDVHAPDPFGRSYAATIDRAATAAAQAFAGGVDDANTWRRVAAVVRRVFEEEDRAQASSAQRR